MITHSIQHRFTPEELASAAAAASVMRELFSFCAALEPQERHDLYKLGPGTESFVTRILAVAQQHLDLLPRGMDVDALAARAQTRETLRFYFEQLQPLVLRMQHSIMLLGAEILRDSLKVYKTLKVNGQEAGLQELLAEIGKRFYTKKPKRKEVAAKDQNPGATQATPMQKPAPEPVSPVVVELAKHGTGGSPHSREQAGSLTEPMQGRVASPLASIRVGLRDEVTNEARRGSGALAPRAAGPRTGSALVRGTVAPSSGG